LANSPYFGARKQIASVSQAISLLGTRRVFDLAASAWFGQAIPPRVLGYDVSAKSYWLHCLAVGLLAEQLVLESRIEVPGMLFTAGLLHDIGKLAVGTIIMHRTEELFEQMENNEKSFIEAEYAIVGTEHTVVGACMLEEWQLPEELVWAARWHHSPGDCPEGVNQTLVDVVNLADSIAYALGFGTDAGELTRRLDSEAVHRLSINREQIEYAASETTICHIWEMGDMVKGSVDA